MILKEFAIITITIFIIMFLLIIFMFIKIQKLSKNNIKENFSSDDLAKVRTEINKIYDMDVEAIRNLGHISKSLLTGTNYHSTAPGTPGDLTIPADNTKFKGKVSVDGGINMAPYQTLSSDGRMHISGNEILYLLNKEGVHISNAWEGNGNLTVDGTINMANGGTLQSSAGRMHIAGLEKLYLLNRQGVHISNEWDGNGNLTVDGDIKIGNITINANGITIGRTTIDKDGNIIYGSIKPNPNNPETPLRMMGNGANDGTFSEMCPEGKTMAGINGWAQRYVDKIQAVCR